MKTKMRILFAVLLALAAAVRFADTGARPMHVDEAVQAFIFSDLLEQGEYRYDPAHYHGPLPHFINLPLMRALGIRSIDALEAWQFRLQPALAGLLLAALAGACAGREAAARWRAMLLAAVSPMLVYFSRMAIHETLLALCALAVPFAVARWLERRQMRWLLAAAAAFGCMHATKETWCIIAFGWAAAAFVLWPRKVWGAVRSAGAWRIALAVAAAMAVSFLLYSNFGRRPEGFADAWRTLFAYRTGGGHEKGWWYFLTDCLGFYRAGGWIAGEGVIVLLALAGGVAAWLRRRAGQGGAGIPPLPLFFAVSGAAQVVVYSIIRYKTPWLALVPLASFVPLAAHGWAFWSAAAQRSGDAAFGRGENSRASQSGVAGRLRSLCHRTPKYLLDAACTLAVVAGLVVPMVTSSFRAPTDTDFRFVYAPTLPDADAELARIAAALPADAVVAVIGDDYWPLPWYFRAMRDRVGYFSEADAPPAAELREFALVIHAGYQLDPAVTGAGWRVLELRPGYFVSVSR